MLRQYLILLVIMLISTQATFAQASERGDIHDLAWSPEGKLLAVLADKGVWFYDTADWAAPPEVIPLVENVVRNIAFSPDGSQLAVGAAPVTSIFDTQTHEILLTIPDSDYRIIGYSPDGSQLALAQNWIEVRDAETGEAVKRFGDYYWSISAMALSPDGRWIATSNSGEGGHLWNLETETQVPDLHLLSDDFAFSPDSSRLVYSQPNGTINVWDVNKNQLALVPNVIQDSRVTDIAYSSDGSWLAVSYANGVLAFLDAETGELLDTLQAHSPSGDNVLEGEGLAFNPDSTLLATGSDDGTVGIWQIEDKSVTLFTRLDGFTPADKLLAG